MSQYNKFNNESENMKSTIDLMEQNYKNSINISYNQHICESNGTNLNFV